MRTRIVITAPFPTLEETAREYGMSAAEVKRVEKDIEWLRATSTRSGAGRRRARQATRRVRTAKAARSGSAKK